MTSHYEVYVQTPGGVNLYPVREDGTFKYGDAPIQAFKSVGLHGAILDALTFCKMFANPIPNESLVAARCIGGGIGLFTVTEHVEVTSKVERATVAA